MPLPKPTLGSIRLTPHVSIGFQRTLRIPDDGRTYPLPPGLGHFPIRRVGDFSRRVPPAWRERGGWFIPIYQREAMWLSFDASWWRPSALMIGIGGINAISGRRWRAVPRRRPQNYVVVPDQPWLDGINAGRGIIRQFVAMPLGSGYTVEGQLTGKETEGGIQLAVIEPKPGRFPAKPPRGGPWERLASGLVCCESTPAMGLAAGGRMKQAIYPDRHGLDTWDASCLTTTWVHLVNSEMYEEITGEPAPPTPISARTYTEYGLPWFDLYDEHKGDVPPPQRLAGVKSVAQLGDARDSGGSEDEGLEIPPSQVHVAGQQSW